MDDFSIWELVALGLLLSGVQAGIQWLFEAIRKSRKKRIDKTVCALYINDAFQGKHTLSECRAIYEDVPFDGHKGSGFSHKNKTFHIHVDR